MTDVFDCSEGDRVLIEYDGGRITGHVESVALGVVRIDSDEPTVTVSVTDSGALRRHESDNEPSRLLSRDADLTPL
jgi:hypothetical protein